MRLTKLFLIIALAAAGTAGLGAQETLRVAPGQKISAKTIGNSVAELTLEDNCVMVFRANHTYVSNSKTWANGEWFRDGEDILIHPENNDFDYIVTEEQIAPADEVQTEPKPHAPAKIAAYNWFGAKK